MSDPLWTAEALRQAVGGRGGPAAATAITGISIDSRTLQAAEAFIAIKGDTHDGHAFVPNALGAGAACAVVSGSYALPEDAADPDAEAKLIRVEDPLTALQDLGCAARARARNTKVIAVTGSAGKTGTKEALRLALSPSGSVHASAKSYNNHWGVPLSLANMAKITGFGIFEAGMNHAGELTPLSRMIRPDIAIITTVEAVHLGHFASLAEIADAKAEIFEGLEPGGTAILNRDNSFFERLSAKAWQHSAAVIGFGEDAHADVRLIEASLDIDGSDVHAVLFGEPLRYRIGAPGRHLVLNSLAVLAAVSAAGADLAAGASALADWHAQAGRGQWHSYEVAGGKIAVIDEAYNANPASMRAALATLSLVPRQAYRRRIAVLGDMLELGEQGPALHRALSEFVDAAGVDVVFACGELMAELFAALPASRRGAYAKTAQELAPRLIEAVRPGDVVMIKGSFGTRLGLLVESLKRELESGATA